MARQVVLDLMCGMAASGKSTLARELAAWRGGVVLHEDEWLVALFGGEMRTLGDYQRCATRLRAAMSAHVVALLRAGMPVVLDFPANTRETRNWMRRMIDTSGVRHEMHVLDVDPEVCWQRLKARDAGGGHPFTLNRVQFDQILAQVTEPAEDEGFTIRRHRP